MTKSVLSEMPDGCGYHYGFAPGDQRQINVRKGPADLLWRAHVGGERVGDDNTGVWETKDEAEAAALQTIAKADPRDAGRVT